MQTITSSSSQFARASLWTLTLLLPTARAQVGTITQEVSLIAGYAQQKVCAQSCFQWQVGNCAEDVLGSKIGCAFDNGCGKVWQAKNDCYCRTDLQQPAQDWLTSCVQSKCSVGDSRIDASSAGGIYGQYCRDKGYTPPPAPTVLPATATKSGNTSPAATRGSGPGSLPSQTSTSSTQSGNSSSSSNSLPMTTIVGIAIGGLVGLIILVFAIQKFVRNHRNRQAQYPPQYPIQNPIYVHEQPKQPTYTSYSQPPYQQQPMFPPPSYPQPMYSQQQQWQSQPQMPPQRTDEEVSPDDSVSVVGARPAPTLVSGTGPAFGRG